MLVLGAQMKCSAANVPLAPRRDAIGTRWKPPLACEESVSWATTNVNIATTTSLTVTPKILFLFQNH